MANAIIAAILSFIIPGLGQAYGGDIRRGIFVFIAAFITILIVSFVFKDWFYTIIDILISIYAAYDAYDLING